MSKESAPVKGFGSFGPSVKIHCQKEQVCRQRKSQKVRGLQITKNLLECGTLLGAIFWPPKLGNYLYVWN